LGFFTSTSKFIVKPLEFTFCTAIPVTAPVGACRLSAEQPTLNTQTMNEPIILSMEYLVKELGDGRSNQFQRFTRRFANRIADGKQHSTAKPANR
jgi:hypothetical protein